MRGRTFLETAGSRGRGMKGEVGGCWLLALGTLASLCKRRQVCGVKHGILWHLGVIGAGQGSGNLPSNLGDIVKGTVQGGGEGG